MYWDISKAYTLNVHKNWEYKCNFKVLEHFWHKLRIAVRYNAGGFPVDPDDRVIMEL